MNQIKTYIFLDIETTGITEHEIHKAKITELSLIAVERNHLISTRIGLMPRIQNKITLCLNPRKQILPGCSKETGLWNDLLENESDFNINIYNILNTFINIQPGPVCLIAHNGLHFDFPILKSHLDKLGVTFSEDLVCSDSLFAFYEIMESTKIKSTGEVILDTIDLVDDDNDIQIVNEKTPVKHPVIESKTPTKVNPNSPSKLQQGQIWFKKKPQKSYRLKDIYETLLKRSPRQAHQAENDCLMLLECSVAKSEAFVQWVDMKNCKFSDIIPLSTAQRNRRQNYF